MRRRERLPLLAGETLTFELRAHGYTLAAPALVLILVSGVASFIAATVPDADARTTLRAIIAATATAIALRWSVWPFLSWYGRSYVLTSHRLLLREGVFARRGHDIPLDRVVGASFTRTVLQRIFGCGRLTISTAGQHGEIVFEDAPKVAEVQHALAALAATAPPTPHSFDPSRQAAAPP